MTTQELYQYLQSKDLYCEIYEIEDGFLISVEWGDWKHDHRYLEHLMGELDYILVDKKITNEDGSDCYSADHYYKKNGGYVKIIPFLFGNLIFLYYLCHTIKNKRI